MIRNEYPTQGQYNAEELDPDTSEQIYKAVDKYTKLFRAFCSFILAFLLLSVISFFRSVPDQLEAWKDNSGNIFPVAYVSLAMEGIVFFAIAMFFVKLYTKGSSIVSMAKNRKYTFNIGNVTDKSSYRSENGGSNKTIYVDNIPCSDISHYYYNSRLGDPCYILFFGKATYCYPVNDNSNSYE